ncbi:MAG: ABC transporter permease [Vicinamibacterales bacterium]
MVRDVLEPLTASIQRWVTAVDQASLTLRANPMRTVLGALATGVAVAAIVIVSAALDGVALFARRTSERAFGANTFLLAQVASPGRVTRRQLEEQLRRNPPLTRSEARYLDRLSGDMVTYAPSAQATSEVAYRSNVFENAAVTGTTASLAELRDLGIGRGRFFLEQEERTGAQVAVIGADVAESLFPGIEPLGQAVRIAGRGFDVVGVQDRLGNTGGASQDRYVWIPLIAYERAFGSPRTLQIFGKTTGQRPSVVGEDRARASLRARRKLGPGVEDTFDLLTPEAARDFVQRLAEQISLAAWPISLMALLAAIVVVTNTVLVSVTQRTREIGVRRALGASRRAITEQVLAEAALTALAGGAAGVLLAVGLVAGLAAALELPVSVRASTLCWGIVASTMAGVLAGWYPARRATRLDPVDAMRIE